MVYDLAKPRCRNIRPQGYNSKNEIHQAPVAPIWQRNYDEHIIRTGENSLKGEENSSLHRIREYMAENSQRWHLNRENPLRKGEDEFDRLPDSYWESNGGTGSKTASGIGLELTPTRGGTEGRL